MGAASAAILKVIAAKAAPTGAAGESLPGLLPCRAIASTSTPSRRNVLWIDEEPEEPDDEEPKKKKDDEPDDTIFFSSLALGGLIIIILINQLVFQ